VGVEVSVADLLPLWTALPEQILSVLLSNPPFNCTFLLVAFLTFWSKGDELGVQ
jgi:hypothetical protein